MLNELIKKYSALYDDEWISVVEKNGNQYVAMLKYPPTHFSKLSPSDSLITFMDRKNGDFKDILLPNLKEDDAEKVLTLISATKNLIIQRQLSEYEEQDGCMGECCGDCTCEDYKYTNIVENARLKDGRYIDVHFDYPEAYKGRLTVYDNLLFYLNSKDDDDMVDFCLNDFVEEDRNKIIKMIENKLGDGVNF